MLRNLKEGEKGVFLLFMDLDGLKEVNDTRGHEMGDLLISTMAEVIRENVRDKEIAMRYGGDEFVIMGEQDGDGRMGNLEDGLRKGMDLWNRKNDIFCLSASIGGSSFRADEVEDLGRLVEQADRRMYEEKRGKKRR